jgi:hypothetical protein
MKCQGYENVYSQIPADVMVGGFIRCFYRLHCYRTVFNRVNVAGED